VEEPEFWRRLEFRICAEFEGFEDNELRWYWCDGLLPDRYDRHGGHWHISGRAWIETQNKPAHRSAPATRRRGQRRPGQRWRGQWRPGQWRPGQWRDSRPGPWTFTLIVRHTGERDTIDWDGLLPTDRLTGWLTPDPASGTLKIDPASGYED
jgi:hypothetical protein